MSKFDVHPEMKTSYVKNGTQIDADLAVATLANEVKFSDLIYPVCLPDDKLIKTSLVVGQFSGWSFTFDTIEDFNSSFTKGHIDEFTEIRPNENVTFAEGLFECRHVSQYPISLNNQSFCLQALDSMLNKRIHCGLLREFYHKKHLMPREKKL